MTTDPRTRAQRWRDALTHSGPGYDPPSAADFDDLVPAWEAMYEPGNVSDYLIGYTNSEAAARGAAEAWLHSEADVDGRLEWMPQQLAAGSEYDQWHNLIRHDPELGTCDTGINVRHRIAAGAEGSAR